MSLSTTTRQGHRNHHTQNAVPRKPANPCLAAHVSWSLTSSLVRLRRTCWNHIWLPVTIFLRFSLILHGKLIFILRFFCISWGKMFSLYGCWKVPGTSPPVFKSGGDMSPPSPPVATPMVLTILTQLEIWPRVTWPEVKFRSSPFEVKTYIFRCVSTRGTRWCSNFRSNSLRSKIMGEKLYCNFQWFRHRIYDATKWPKIKISEIYTVFIKNQTGQDIDRRHVSAPWVLRRSFCPLNVVWWSSRS